ncbi:hypothetical protein ADK93_00785 [Streptomyces sp. XY58]|nr:hypothetical protein ADK93_00785 [Streptomyces sp. XY58]KOV43126.1 hypothetical protein ADK99_29485 [Streptomyces sp. MMG1064]
MFSRWVGHGRGTGIEQGGTVDEDQMARAVARGMHQYDADQRVAERRRVRKMALYLWLAALAMGLVILGSFGKLGF